jgi:hypothetical protein
MGNSRSKIKLCFKKKNSKKIGECIEYSNEEYEKYKMIIEEDDVNFKYHFSNQNDNDLDRQHSNHFLRRYVYNSNYSSPVEEKLVQGCKVLDVGYVKKSEY